MFIFRTVIFKVWKSLIIGTWSLVAVFWKKKLSRCVCIRYFHDVFLHYVPLTLFPIWQQSRMSFRMMPRIPFPVMPLKVIPFRMMPVWCVMTIRRVCLLPFWFSFGLTHVHIPRWFDISHWVLNFLYFHTQVPVVFVYPTHILNKVVIIRWVFSIGAIKKKQIYYKIV